MNKREERLKSCWEDQEDVREAIRINKEISEGKQRLYSAKEFERELESS